MINSLNLLPAVLLLLATLTVFGCNNTGGTNSETRDEISRLNTSRERLSPGR